MNDLGALVRDQPLLALTIASILLAVLAGMLGSSPRLSRATRGAAYLGLIAALLLTVAQLAGRNERSEAALWLDQTRPATVEGGQTVVAMRADGHFWVKAQLNGQPVDFLIDTGATYTGVSRRTARRAGLALDEDRAGMILDTANGPVVARLAIADSLRFGSIETNGLPIAVGPDSEVESNVIGMNLLSQLASWRVEGKRLILVPRGGQAAGRT